VVAINAPLYLAVCTCAPLLIRVFGHHYASGTTTMVVVSAAGLVGVACGLVDYVLITAGRATWNLGNSALALVLNVVIDVVFIPHIGIIAAAIGWALAIAVNNVLPLWQIRSSLGFSPVSAIWARVLVAAGIGFGLLPGLTVWLSHRSILATVVALAIGSIAYLGALWLWRDALGLNAAAFRRSADAA
jgi:O-antigen/teichoic acid export membrane protein